MHNNFQPCSYVLFRNKTTPLHNHKLQTKKLKFRQAELKTRSRISQKRVIVLYSLLW